MGIFPRNLMLGGKKGSSQQENLSSWKISDSSNNISNNLQDDTEISVMRSP